MPYLFKDFEITNINKDGTIIQGPTAIAANAITGHYDLMAIGNRIRLKIDFEATGPDNFNSKLLRVNLGLFTNGFTAFDAGAFSLGFQSNGFLPAVAAEGLYPSINNLPEAQNIYATFIKIDATNATAEIDFYVTLDINRFSGIAPSPHDRFLLNLINNPNELRNSLASAYSALKNIGIVANVFDYVGTNQQVLHPVTSANFIELPAGARWYNSNFLGVTTNMRYIQAITATSPSQIAATLPNLTDATATAAQGATAAIDPTFTVTTSQLSGNEKNSIEIVLSGRAFAGTPNPPVTDIRVLLIRTDIRTGGAIFPTVLEMSEAIIPQATPGVGVLDGALATPSDWVENVPAVDDITLTFDIDGNLLTFGARYRIIVNVYDSANEDYVTAHISPELSVTYISPAIPTLTGTLSTYNKEYTGNELTIAPHQRIKATLEIDKVAYDAALAALGFTQTFDTCLAGVIASLTNITGVVNQVQGYIPPVVLTPDMTKVTDNGTTLTLSAIFRISEEYANTSTSIVWHVTFNQPVGGGLTDLVRVAYTQKLDVSPFENDVTPPDLLAVNFYDIDFYPTQKIQIIDLCDVQQIIAEVEKDPTFTGSINLIATIYPADELGDTQPQAIEEEEDWAPTVIQMSQAVSGKLDNVDQSFGADDFAIFRINIPQLNIGQRYWVTAIAFKQVPDYCPIGLVAFTTFSNGRSGTALPGWYVVSDPSLFIAEILAHPDYVGGLNVVQNETTGALYTTYVGYVGTAFAINQALGTVNYNLVVDAIFDPGTGPHTVRHTLQVPFIVPPIPNLPPSLSLSNAYLCNDLG